MAVRLRLQRHGAKKRPFYRLVATDIRSPRDGRFNEVLGTFNPMVEPNMLDLNIERIDYWLGVGAQPTETVATLIKRARTGEGFVTQAQALEINKAEAAKRREAAFNVKEYVAPAPAAAPAPEAEEAPAEEGAEA